MIRVTPQPEPENFDRDVRQKGRQKLEKLQIDATSPLPPKTKLPDLWRRVASELRERYRFCAYTNIECSLYEGDVDHFKSKSQYPALAYEWSNYRLALPAINRRKRDYEDVLDPFEIKNTWFELKPLDGSIHPSAKAPKALREKIQATIKRLRLNNPRYCGKRLAFIKYYENKEITAQYLKENAPFIYYALRRQKLL